MICFKKIFVEYTQTWKKKSASLSKDKNGRSNKTGDIARCHAKNTENKRKIDDNLGMEDKTSDNPDKHSDDRDFLEKTVTSSSLASDEVFQVKSKSEGDTNRRPFAAQHLSLVEVVDLGLLLGSWFLVAVSKGEAVQGHTKGHGDSQENDEACDLEKDVLILSEGNQGKKRR
jgi:hypothetical protein